MPVYFIQAETGEIKIGYTNNPRKRLRTAQIYSPCNLELLAVINGDRSKEHHIQSMFQDSRLHGEWFEQTPELLDFIQERTETDEWIEGDNAATGKEPLTISIEPELRKQVEQVAKQRDRSMSYLISQWIMDGLRAWRITAPEYPSTQEPTQ